MPTHCNRAQRGKLLEWKPRHLNLKSQVPNSKSPVNSNRQIPKAPTARWNFGFEPYLEYEVRDLLAGVGSALSSARFGFPPAPTPLAVSYLFVFLACEVHVAALCS